MSFCKEFLCIQLSILLVLGLVLLSLTYNGKISFCGNADVAWLTKEELDDVFEEFPKTLERMAMKSC